MLSFEHFGEVSESGDHTARRRPRLDVIPMGLDDRGQWWVGMAAISTKLGKLQAREFHRGGPRPTFGESTLF